MVEVKSFVDEISAAGVKGWVASDAAPGASLEVQILVDGVEHGRIVADLERPGLREVLGNDFTDRHAFFYRFVPALELDRDVLVHVMTADGWPLSNGARVLRGKTRKSTAMQPLLVSSRGRSGSTLLMRELARHSEVTVAEAYPFEIRHASYYAVAAQLLNLPRFGDRGDFADIAERDAQLTGNPWNDAALNAELGGGMLARLLADSIPRRLADFCREAVLDIYQAIALHQRKEHARFFAEKTWLTDNVRYGLRDLFGGVREIILVRDPRDFLCSGKAFWHQSTSDLIGQLAPAIGILLDLHRRAEPDTMFLRYEDLILNPSEAMRRVCDFIGAAELPLEDPTISPIVGHVTSTTPAASVGRWRTELAPADAALCRRIFPAYMEQFGYSD